MIKGMEQVLNNPETEGESALQRFAVRLNLAIGRPASARVGGVLGKKYAR
jgi:hypothetical protein